MRAALVWFRRDLRLADHEPLSVAASGAPAALLPFFCLEAAELRGEPGGGASGGDGAAAEHALSPPLGLPTVGPHHCRCACWRAAPPRCLTHAGVWAGAACAGRVFVVLNRPLLEAMSFDRM